MSISNLHFRFLLWILPITGRSRTALSFPAGNLETQPDLSRHQPVEHFLGEAFPKAHSAPWALWPCVALDLPGVPDVKPSLCHTLLVFFHLGTSSESTELQKSHRGHTPQSNSSVSPGPQGLWWWWSTARLPHSALSPPAFITIISWVRKSMWQMLFRCRTAKKADGFQEHFSPSCPLCRCLSHVSALPEEGKGNISWNILWLSLCHGWQPYPLFANEKQE